MGGQLHGGQRGKDSLIRCQDGEQDFFFWKLLLQPCCIPPASSFWNQSHFSCAAGCWCAVRADGRNVTKFAGHRDEVCGLRFSYSEAQLASGSNDNTCAIWDMRRLPISGASLPRNDFSLHRFTEHIAAVKALSWSPTQANLLASGGGSADRCIKVWNTADGSNVSSLQTDSQVNGACRFLELKLVPERTKKRRGKMKT